MALSWRRLFEVSFVLVAFGFLGALVYGNLDEMRAFRWEVRPGVLAASLLAHVGVLLWGVAIWQRVLGHLGVGVRFAFLARVWFISGIGRYIPGKIWQFVGVAQMGAAAGLSPLLVVTSLAVQMGFTLLGAALAAAYLLPADLWAEARPVVQFVRWTIPLSLLLVHPRVIQSALRLFAWMTRRSVIRWDVGWGSGIVLLLLSTLNWAFYGVAFYLFVASLVPAEAGIVAELSGMNALAFLVGYLVFIAPAGMGAKEGALTFLLATLFPGGVAAALALGARLWTIAAELIPVALLLRQRPLPTLRDRERADQG